MHVSSGGLGHICGEVAPNPFAQIFKETLQLLQVVSSVTDEDIYILFARYNAQQDGMLTLEDLTSMIAPVFF